MQDRKETVSAAIMGTRARSKTYNGQMSYAEDRSRASASPFGVLILLLARLAMAAAVLFMAGWNTYICLRLRPDFATVFINLAFWIVPVAVLLALSGRLWRSIALGTALTFVLQRLHWLKWKYLEHTWTAADFRLLFDSVNWIILRQYPAILGFALLCVALLVVSWFLVPRGTLVVWRMRGASALVASAMVGGVYYWQSAHIYDPFGFNIYGHFANLIYSVSTLVYHAPTIDGDDAQFVARAASVPAPVIATPAQPPDIVIWLQESTMDLGLFAIPGADLPKMPMYQRDAMTRAHGLLRVPTWGGSTWLSEFALLSGLSHEDFGPSGYGVYYIATAKTRYSLSKLLKQRAGYRSIAISGSPKAFYNMETAQRDLGFDEVLNPLDFPQWGNKALAEHLISDEEIGRYALEILGRPHDTPILLFVLTIRQHGPYSSEHPIEFGLDKTTLDRRTAARLSDYAQRMKETQEANQAFGAQWLAQSRPVIFAYFGDHQANVEGEVPFVSGLTQPHFLTLVRHQDELRPWRARCCAAGPGPRLHERFPPAYAGVPLDEFFTANRAMRVLCEGRLNDCPDAALLRSYRTHVYGPLQAAARE